MLVILSPFAHRNITECSYPSIVKSRRAAMTEADLKLIQEFTASQRNQLQSFEIMGVLSIGFVIVIVLMVRRAFAELHSQ